MSSTTNQSPPGIPARVVMQHQESGLAAFFTVQDGVLALVITGPEATLQRQRDLPLAFRGDMRIEGQGEGRVYVTVEFGTTPPLTAHVPLALDQDEDRDALALMAVVERLLVVLWPTGGAEPLYVWWVTWAGQVREAVRELAALGLQAAARMRQWRDPTGGAGAAGTGPRLHWGREGAALLDVVALLDDKPPALPHGECFVQAEWSRSPRETLPFLPGQGANWRGIWAVWPPEVGLRFVWPAHEDPLTALRGLVEASREEGRLVPWALVGGVFAALQAMRAGLPVERWRAVAGFLVSFGADLPWAAEPLPTRKELERQVQQWDGRWETLPRHPYALAQFAWQVGKGNWLRYNPRLTSAVAAAWTAAYGLTTPPPWRLPMPGGGHLQVEGQARGLLLAWGVRHTLASGPIEPAGLDYLLPQRLVRPAAQSRLYRDPAGDQPASGTSLPEDPTVLRSLAARLLQEAAQEAAYVPTGPFAVPVPAHLLLHQWGVAELRLWADPAGFWGSLVSAEGHLILVLRWQPEQPQDWHFFMVPPWARESLHFVLAALWRDMRVRAAGPPVFPRRQRQGAGGGDREARSSPRGAGRAHVQSFPRRASRSGLTVWPGAGAYEWGRPHEQQAARSAYRVAGHYRSVLYVAELGAAVLRVAAGQADVAAWAERQERAGRRQDWPVALWWQAMQGVAGQVAVSSDPPGVLAERLAQVEAILTGWQRRRWDQDMAGWLEAGLRLLHRAAAVRLDQVLAGVTEPSLRGVLLAATPEPPLARWTEQRAQAAAQGRYAEAVWWQMLAVAAQHAQALDRVAPEESRMAAVAAVLAKAARWPWESRWAQWLHTGLQAIGKAQEQGVAAVLAALEGDLERTTAAACRRAAANRMPPPPGGLTFVVPHPVGGHGGGAPIVVQAQGLLAVSTFLGAASAAEPAAVAGEQTAAERDGRRT